MLRHALSSESAGVAASQWLYRSIRGLLASGHQRARCTWSQTKARFWRRAQCRCRHPLPRRLLRLDEIRSGYDKVRGAWLSVVALIRIGSEQDRDDLIDRVVEEVERNAAIDPRPREMRHAERAMDFLLWHLRREGHDAAADAVLERLARSEHAMSINPVRRHFNVNAVELEPLGPRFVARQAPIRRAGHGHRFPTAPTRPTPTATGTRSAVPRGGYRAMKPPARNGASASNSPPAGLAMSSAMSPSATGS